MKRFCIVLLLAGALACGRMGPPRPPEDFAPAALKAFEVRGTVGGVVLRWNAPESTAAGDPLEDLLGFSVKRSSFEVGESPDYDELVFVEFNSEEPAAEPENVKTAKLFEYNDKAVEPGKVYDYLVVPVNERGVEGEIPGKARVTFIGQSSIIELQ
ncbi:MAG: hypothetical protein KDD66_14415 [Bdellovibrionales bacterium]|nr:hypothetical protein [Bdellovibrionales bacterium]